jgi:signal transduction histidine kinase
MSEPKSQASGAPGVEETLPFEQMLADLSAGFVNLAADRVDGAIDDALRRIVELLGVERCNLVRFTADGESYVTHTWSVAGVPAVVLRSISSDFPWLVRCVRRGVPVVVASIDNLPPEAAVDAATWRRVGVKSNLTLPMTVGARIEGAIALASLRREREWPEHLVSRLRIIADVFGNALAHKRAQEDLEAAMAFEQRASAILGALLTAAPADQDPVIEAGLGDMARVFGAERATLWQRIGAKAEFTKTHRWLAEGVPLPPTTVGAMITPWLTERLVRGDVVRFASLRELPPEAAADLPGLRALHIRAAVVVPLTVSGVVVGALAFATTHGDRAWPAALVPRIRLFGEVLASVLARRAAERREQEANAQAAHAARVGAMGAFAASLAHELTQPLAASLANAETGVRLLDASNPDLEELRATLADIVADERRAGDLVQKLRRFLRRGEVERGPIALREMLEEVLQLVAREAQARGIALRLDVAEDLPEVAGDRVQLQQVVLNLLSNAIDAVEAAKPVRRDVELRAARCGDGVAIEVRDSGAGMDDQTLGRIFQPFFTTKPGGMGLGLSISRTIVEAHGGMIAARSAPGDGTVFRIELPARPARDVPAAQRVA